MWPSSVAEKMRFLCKFTQFMSDLFAKWTYYTTSCLPFTFSSLGKKHKHMEWQPVSKSLSAIVQRLQCKDKIEKNVAALKTRVNSGSP